MSGNILHEKSFFSVSREDKIALVVLLGVTVFFRLFLLQMINVGPDEIDYWFSAKRLVFGGDYPEIMHRTIRWSVILPTALVQRIFSAHPLVYYLPAVFSSLVHTVVFYFFGKKLLGRPVAFYAGLILIAWPYMWRTGSQIRPAVFSLTYVLVSLYALFIYLDEAGRKKSDGYVPLIVSTVFLFLAYQSKITNLYFLPGIFLLLWRYKRRIKEPAIYGGILFGLYLIEHLSYWLFAGIKTGRLGIIASHHMTGDFAERLPNGFAGLFARYTEYMELPWKLLFLMFIAATVFLLFKKKKWVFELTVLHVSFFFFLTFMVKSIHPIQPVEPFLDRYYIVNLPTMSLVIVYALRTLLSGKAGDFLFKRSVAYILSLLLIVFIIGVTALPLPSAARRFFTPLNELSSHPIPSTFRFMDSLEAAVEGELPMISVDTAKPLDTANRVFYDNPGIKREAAVMVAEDTGGHRVYSLVTGGETLDLKNPDQKVLWCDRFNFDMRIVLLKDIPALSDLYLDL